MFAKIKQALGKLNKSLVKTIAFVAVIATVLVVAVIATGYQAQRLSLDDGSVWVANAKKQAVGRANTKVLELNTVLTTDSAKMTLLQNSSSLFIFNDATHALDIVSQATGEITESVPLPQDVSMAKLSGNDMVLHSATTGDIWVVPVSALSQFDAKAQPANFNVGADSSVNVDSVGNLVAVSADTGFVSTVNIFSGSAVATQQLDGELTAGNLSVSMVGQRWIVLDTATSTAFTQGRKIDLTSVADLTSAVMQNPSEVGVSSQGVGGTSTILLSHSRGLLSLDLDSGLLTVLSESGQGTPATPVIENNCAYAAWSGAAVWKQCGSEPSSVDAAEQMSGSASLVFQNSSGILALNDTDTGMVWAVQDGVRLIDNWDDLLAQQQEQQQVIQTNNADAPEFEKNPLPPVAVDDELGARPGRVTALPVLLNDYDPNGDALVIEEVSAIPAALGDVFINADRNQVMIRLNPDASGSTDFSYTISDGRGAEASATVTVPIRPESENSPPVQARPSRVNVVVGGQVVVNVLGDWVDPDGDAIFISSATVDAPDSVTYSPSGRIAFTDAGGVGGVKQIALEVSDGRSSGFGSVDVNVKSAGQVPIITEAFAVIAVVGQPVVISPAPHVRGGSSVVSLSAVSDNPGVDIVPDFPNFSFTATPSRTGSTYLTYAVTDGDQTSSGYVRLDVIEPPDVSAPPIAAAHAVYVPLQQARTVDVTATDRDPAGAVLVVTEVLDIPADSGLQVEIIDHRLVRVTLTKPLDEAVAFGYRISNGVSQSQGTITVVQTPAPRIAQAPVAVADVVSVRVGDAISIPVLANDIHPDGGLLTLGSQLDQNVPESAGLLFSSGSQLRFLASDRPGTYSAVYRVNADNGQWASGTLTISVRAIDENTNQSPTARTVIARAMSGQSIRIPIPVVGIDPDGDSVQFVGLDTNPEKGSITQVGGDWIEYEASAYATGTDVFSYSVVDALGAQASAEIQVGIAEPVAGGRNPIAVADTIVARPGATVYVRPLQNDSDPDGRQLSIVSVTPSDNAVAAEILGNVVKLTVPLQNGRYGLVYEIENDLAGSASNFITVEVQDEAPLSAPVISDHVVSLSDILNHSSVDVDVLKNAFFADGPVSTLRASVVSGYGTHARAVSAGVIRIEVLATSQIIPYRVANPADSSVSSTAFIWVPGTDDALPQRKKGVTSLKVVSEEPLRININDYVIAALGREVRLTDNPNVRATHADGSRLVVNETTLSYTSEDRYFGPASIAFDVTDGTRQATIVLPITVTPRENMPPVMLGANIDLEPGQEKTLDLVKVTRYPYVDDQDELEYTISGAGQGLSATVNGQILTLRASDDAVKGRSVQLDISVRDQVNEGTSGVIQVRFVASTRPIAIPATDNVIAKRGETKTIDVLANDAATNPYPSVPLKVISVRGLGDGNIPAGVSVSPSADKSSLTITVSNTAEPSDTTIEYEVADATNDPDRYVWGVVQISVQDVPDAPGAPSRAAGFVSGALTLTWPAPASNNSPITKYVVENDSGYRKECASTVCTLDGLPTGSRSRFSVTAVNSIGTSAPSPWSTPLSADVVPAAPASVTISTPAYDSNHPDGGGIQVSWSAVGSPAGGSAVSKYVVKIVEDGSTIRGTFDVAAGTTSLGPLWYSAGHSYVATVTAMNDADSDEWNSTSSNSVVAAGPPTALQITNITNAADGASTVTWNAASAPSSGGQLRYILATSSSPLLASCPANYASMASTTSLSATDSAKPTGRYYVAVYAYNSYGCIGQTSQTDVELAPGVASYQSAQCLLADSSECVVGTPAGTSFVIRVVSPTVSANSGPTMTWQIKVGNTWVDLTDVSAGGTPTFEITSSQYFAASGASGSGQTVIIRGCITATNCGTEGGSTQITIPAP